MAIMPNYDMPLYRPPSEGDNLIIQATLGCSFNRCGFCSMYRQKTFKVRPLEMVFADIDRAAAAWPQAHRVFLADGDALVLPSDHLLKILHHLAKRLPGLTRVSCYALPANLLKKNVDELSALRQNRLSLIYYGIETGCAELLKRITKGASVDGMIEGLLKAREADIKVSATVVLGLGGKRLWRSHIDGTVELLHRAPVTYLSTLQLYLDPALATDYAAAFAPPLPASGRCRHARRATSVDRSIDPPPTPYHLPFQPRLQRPGPGRQPAQGSNETVGANRIRPAGRDRPASFLDAWIVIRIPWPLWGGISEGRRGARRDP